MRMTMCGALAALLAAASSLGGCGGAGGKTVGEYEQIVIGTGGGHAEAQNVALVVPPGAFTEDHVCAILEQPDPLPIEPQGDGSTIVYHDNIMCIGPLDLELLVPGYLRMCYPLTGFPPGLGEDDLVLLEWDGPLGLMRVAADAVQNLATHCFEDFSYETFGHVAVGLRLPPPDPDELDFAFFSDPQVAAAGLPPTTGIVLVDLDGAIPTALVPNTTTAEDFIGDASGSRLLYRTFDEFESSTLRTVDVPSLTDREVMAADTFAPSSPMFGWFGSDDTVYFDERDLIILGTEPLPNAFGTVPGGGGASTRLYPYAGNLFLEDVRISPDGTMALLRFFDFDQKVLDPRVDVIDLLGNVLVAGLPCDLDSGDPTPRFLPDSSGITFLDDDGVTVRRVDPDGTGEAVLYTLPAANSVLVDFAVAPTFAPAPQRCAYVRRDLGLQEAGLPAGGPDYFETDRLTGGDVQSTSMGGPWQLVDLVPLFGEGWQTPLVAVQIDTGRFLDVSQQGTVVTLPPFSFGLTLFFDLDDATLWKVVPAPLAWIDFSCQSATSAHTGTALVAIPLVDEENFPEYPDPGIYHLDALLENPVLVTPPGYTMAGPPRWLQSWRRAPGFFAFEGVR